MRMTIGPAIRAEPHTCPHCGLVLTGRFSVANHERPVKPRAGTPSICTGCAGVSVIADDGNSLRMPLDAELAMFEADPHWKMTMDSVRHMRDERAAKNKRFAAALERIFRQKE